VRGIEGEGKGKESGEKGGEGQGRGLPPLYLTLATGLHRRSFRGGGLAAPPKPLIMDNIFFQNGISIWHLLYTVIHNHLRNLLGLLSLSVRYARRLNPLKCAYFGPRQAAGEGE